MDDDGSGDYTTIALAIVEGSVGDSILITGGADQIHTEDGIVINKNLNFKGEGQSITILQGAAAYAAADDGILSFAVGIQASVRDMTIWRGNAISTGSAAVDLGGGVYINANSATDIRFDRVFIVDNRTDEDGGGVAIMGGDGTVGFYDCVIGNPHIIKYSD